MRFNDIDPQDIDPDTNRPYAGYSSPSLDTAFHDNEMANDKGAHSYEVDGRAGIRKVTFTVGAQSRTQAAAKVRKLGYEVYSVNMIG